MEKRMFQVFDEMNVADGENNTMNLQVAGSLVSAQTAKGGGHITMGVPANIVHELTFKGEDYICLLLVINKKEYEKLKLNTHE